MHQKLVGRKLLIYQVLQMCIDLRLYGSVDMGANELYRLKIENPYFAILHAKCDR